MVFGTVDLPTETRFVGATVIVRLFDTTLIDTRAGLVGQTTLFVRGLHLRIPFDMTISVEALDARSTTVTAEIHKTEATALHPGDWVTKQSTRIVADRDRVGPVSVPVSLIR